MRWEYKRHSGKVSDIAHASFDEELAALGREGWELACAVPHEQHGYSQETHLLFKRPLPE